MPGTIDEKTRKLVISYGGEDAQLESFEVLTYNENGERKKINFIKKNPKKITKIQFFSSKAETQTANSEIRAFNRHSQIAKHYKCSTTWRKFIECLHRSRSSLSWTNHQHQYDYWHCQFKHHEWIKQQSRHFNVEPCWREC